MVHSGLLICSFFVKERYGRDESKILDLNNEIIVEDITGTHSFPTIWPIISRILNNYTDPHDDESSMKLFSVEKSSIKEINESHYQAITFVISSGSYGIEGKITNRATKTVVYNRTRNDADVKQFRAMIIIPKNTRDTSVQKGIMLFQSIGTYGIKTITIKQIKESFANLNLTFETRTVSISLFLKRILNDGKLKRITLLRNAVSPDFADSLIVSSGREETVYIRPKLHENWIRKFLNYVDGKKDETVFEFNEKIYEDILLSFQLSGRTRTARLKDLDRFSLVEDIPDEIYNNGHTHEESLIEYMMQTAVEYMEKMVFRISD